MTTTPDWVDIIVKLTPAFFTLIVGLVAGGVAYGQYRINRDKLRLDLFTKRLEAYEKLHEFFGQVFREGKVNDAILRLLLDARYKSQFLFGPEIEGHMKELWEDAVDMKSLHSRMYGPSALPVGPERSEVSEKETALLKKMMKQMDSSPKKFAKYLRFH